MNIKVVNPPSPIRIDEYKEQLDIYIDRVSEVPGVRSILSMGSVSTPGLSDLDIICVIDDDFDPCFSSKVSIEGLRRDIFIHGPVVIPRRLLNDLQYVIWASNITHIWGEEELPKTFEQYSRNEQICLAIAYLVDFSESRLVQFAFVENLKLVDKRGWMARLWSLTHTKRLCEIAGITLSKRSQEIIGEVIKCRSDWSKEKLWSDDEFIELFLKSKEIYQEVLNKSLRKKYAGLNTEFMPKDLVYQSGNKRVICKNNINRFRAVYTCFTFSKFKRNYFMIIAPQLYAFHLSSYGFNSRQNQWCIDTVHPVMRKRSYLIRQNQKFINKNFKGISIMAGYMGLSIQNEMSLKGLFDEIYWSAFKHKH